ncbi:MAG: 16S rRNA (guanine(527)-N(7))-methyltransferase RsmG [Thioalkalivibrionaceae bacterium]
MTELRSSPVAALPTIAKQADIANRVPPPKGPELNAVPGPLAHAFAQASLAPELHKPIAHYLAGLERWNHVHNLTRVADPVDAFHRHVLESFDLIPEIDWVVTRHAEECRLIDIGTGAGIPGLLLAIAMHYTNRPALSEILLVEPAAKRVAFLRAMIAELGLAKVRVYPQRLEDLLSEPSHHAAYKVATSRAFAAPEHWLPMIAPLMGADAHALVMLAGKPDDWRPVANDDSIDSGHPRFAQWLLRAIEPQGDLRAKWMSSDRKRELAPVEARHVARFQFSP